MTINYLDAKRIQGLSTDVTDTPTFEDDFSTVKGWIPTGGNFAVNTTTGVMDFNRTNTTTNHSISYDLGAVVSDTWVLRYKVTFTTLGNVASNWIGAGLSDLPSSSAGSASRDFVGTLMAYQNNANAQLFYTTDLNNQSINGGYVDGSSGTSTLFVGTHYVQIVKTSATTYTVTIYSDSNYSIIRGVAQSGTTGATGLRYIVFIPENTGAGGTMVGTIDDIKFYNGVTSLTSKPTIAIPLTGCKAYYKFEETSGNLINQATTANGFTDGLGSSADGTNNGATQTATGKIGNAWYTTSTSNYVSIPNTLINGQNKISISTWFYPTVNGVNDIIFSGIFNYPSLLDWNLRFTQGHSTATIYIPTGTGNAGLNYHDYSGLGLSLNTWHHIAVVYDGTESQNVDRLKYYVNGVLKTPTATNYPIPTSTYTTSYGARLFNLDSNSHAGYNVHNFRLDDLSIWNRALTSNEITNLYNSGSGKLLDTQTNVQTNSIFEQTDTGVRYWYNGTVWKPEYYFAIIASHFYVTTNTEKLDYNTTTTSNSTSLSTAKSGTCAFGTEHIGYFAGGAVTGGYSTSSERFAYSDSVMSSSATLSVYHGWGGAWSRPTIGYVVKGNSGGAYGTTVEKFSHSTNTYSTGTSMTQSSSNGTHQSITIGYSTGRWANGSFGDTQKYTFSSDGVTSGTSLLTTTSAHCASSTQADGIIMGGQTGGGTGFQTRIEKYNHSTDAITLHGSSLTTSGNLNQGYGNTKNAYAIQISQDNNITISNKLNHPTGTITSFNVLLSGNSGSSTTTENEVII